MGAAWQRDRGAVKEAPAPGVEDEVVDLEHGARRLAEVGDDVMGVRAPCASCRTSRRAFVTPLARALQGLRNWDAMAEATSGVVGGEFRVVD
jgi:hypothetical protein